MYSVHHYFLRISEYCFLPTWGFSYQIYILLLQPLFSIVFLWSCDLSCLNIVRPSSFFIQRDALPNSTSRSVSTLCDSKMNYINRSEHPRLFCIRSRQNRQSTVVKASRATVQALFHLSRYESHDPSDKQLRRILRSVTPFLVLHLLPCINIPLKSLQWQAVCVCIRVRSYSFENSQRPGDWLCSRSSMVKSPEFHRQTRHLFTEALLGTKREEFVFFPYRNRNRLIIKDYIGSNWSKEGMMCRAFTLYLCTFMKCSLPAILWIPTALKYTCRSILL